MEVIIEEWCIKKLMDNIDLILDQPVYQRGKVWSKSKNQLLIDSMFRGIDLPKFYFREVGQNGFKYEVADGQQRMHAIRLFYNNALTFPVGRSNGLELSVFEGNNFGNLTFDNLSKKDKDKFKNYKVTIAVLKNATGQETRTLFGRLQEGSKLNPAEKRNAIISPIGQLIDSFVFNHTFFEESKISQSRYRHQDYLAHIFALITYGNKKDLKATLIESMYLEQSAKVLPNGFSNKVALVLDKMHEIDSLSTNRIKNKFSFIDLFYFLYVSNVLEKIVPNEFAAFFDKLENDRLSYRNNYESLSKSRDPWKKELYKYVVPYQSEGYNTSSIEKRINALKNLFTIYTS